MKEVMLSKYRNCPVISLKDTVGKVKMLQESTLPATKQDIAKAMGYKGLNGTSYTVISVSIDYGLLEEVGEDKLKLSTIALDILSPADGTKHREAVQKAAFTPPLFKELWESFRHSSPEDAELIDSLKQLGLHPNKIEGALRAYRETIEFVNEAGSFGGGSLLPPVEKEEQSWAGRISSDCLVLKISLNCRVQLRFEGPVTQEALQKLVELLNLSKDTYPIAGGAEKAPASPKS